MYNDNIHNLFLSKKRLHLNYHPTVVKGTSGHHKHMLLSNGIR